MVVLCPSCNSSEIIFEYECQSYCCSACGSVLDDDEINKDNNDPVNEDTEPANNATLPPLLEARYQPLFGDLQNKFKATDEETDFVRQLCFTYLTHPKHIYENSALEAVLCLFYLVTLQHHQDRSLLLSDYCMLMNGDPKRCLTIYAAMLPIVSTKLATLPNDYDPQHQLDNVMRFLYPALLEVTPSSPTLQQQQRPKALLYYHTTPLTAHKKSRRINKEKQQPRRKRQKRSATTHYTATVTNLDPSQFDTNTSNEETQKHQQQRSTQTVPPPITSTTAATTTTTTTDNGNKDDDDDDIATNLGPGQPLVWPSNMNNMKIRQQTTRLMTVVKRNGIAEGRYGRPLMSACLLITMLGWFHHDQRQQNQQLANDTGIKRTTPAPRGSRSASLLPVVVIQWDELASRQLVNSTTKTRYREIMGLLYTFGKALPWLKDGLSMERDVLHCLDDILLMMDVLQTNNNNNNNNNKRADEGVTSISTIATSPSFERVTGTASSSGTAIPTPPFLSNTTTVTIPTITNIGPFLPPSFERATRVRQKRLAELKAVDQWNAAQQQQDNATAIWNEDSDVADPMRMVATLVASQQYDREAILAMSDSDLVKHAYRFTSSSSTLVNNNATPLDLDRQLDDFDLSKEELASYLVQ